MTLLNPVGCDLALLLLPTTGLHVFLQENKALLCFSQKLDPQHPLQHHEPPPEPMKQ